MDEDNIFLANLAKNNEVEQSRFKKLNKHAIRTLSINQDTTSYVHLPNIEGQKALSNILRTYSQEKKQA